MNPYDGYDETALLNLIERHVSCAMFTLGPRTRKSPPYYLLSVTLHCGTAITASSTTRRGALVQAVEAIDAHQTQEQAA